MCLGRRARKFDEGEEKGRGRGERERERGEIVSQGGGWMVGERERRVCVCVCVCFFFIPSFILGCNSVGLTLNFNTTMIFNNTEYITGIPTQCEDGFVLALCNDDSITQETSDAFCQSFGYNCKRERGKEGGRERGREGGKEGGREGKREGGRERGREGEREGEGREGLIVAEVLEQLQEFVSDIVVFIFYY